MKIRIKIKKMKKYSNNNHQRYSPIINSNLSNFRAEENRRLCKINQSQRPIGPIDQDYLIDHITLLKNRIFLEET